jgi:MoaA/NifB/PqqE/SkfB family radical SAM enzyme
MAAPTEAAPRASAIRAALARLKSRWYRLQRGRRRALRMREIRAGKSILKSPPATINIEFSGRCNIWPPCTYCVGKNAEGYEEPPHIPEDELAPYWKYMLAAERVNDNTYGEPLMYPAIHDVIDRLGLAGVSFGFTSNGLLLTEKKARLLARHSEQVDICISLNAASKEIYFAHQGKDFGKLLVNIERFVKIHNEMHPGRVPPLVISFIVMQSNRHEVMDFIRLGKRLGVKGVLFRHLFDLNDPKFTANNFKHRFVYGEEMLPWEEYHQLEREIRASDEFKQGGIEIYFAWNGQDGFIKGQAEPGVDIPCLFPWKFLCIRPIHGFYTPCVYQKKPMAKTNEMTVEEVWNGEAMQSMRSALAKGEVPQYCCDHSDICPLVLDKRAREAAARAESPEPLPVIVTERRVSLPVLGRV